MQPVRSEVKIEKSMKTLAPVLLVCAAIVVSGCNKSEADKQPEPSASSEAAVTPTPAQAQPETLAGVAAQQGLHEYLCADPSSCGGEVLGASSEQEAAWLRANGYPSNEELRNLQGLSDSQLKAAADTGSVTALVVYGERLALGSDTAGGLDALRNAADRDSIYAYYALSKVYAKNKALRNLVESGSFLRVAYMLGDNKASTAMQTYIPNLHPVENAAIDRRAASLYQTYAKARPPRPRPI
jgi:hypothetical protein